MLSEGPVDSEVQVAHEEVEVVDRILLYHFFFTDTSYRLEEI